MTLTWVLNPLTCLALVAMAMLACLCLFLSLKRELAEVRRSAGESQQSVAAALEEYSRQLDEVRRRLQSVEQQPAPSQSESGLGSLLTRRELALRMHSVGETAASIASALQAPRSEIDLVLKVHRLTQTQD